MPYNLGTNSIISSSIRKHFSSFESTEERMKKEMENYKFKAKPLNRQVYNLNLNLEPRSSLTKAKAKQKEIISFEEIIKASKNEKQAIINDERENKKLLKIKEIKKRTLLYKENKDLPKN